MSDENQLIEGWIQLQYAHRERRSIESLLWAHAVLDEVCDRDPQRCLHIIVRILERDSSDIIVANLAAGPLEDLLARYGPSMIDKIESAAYSRQTFLELLGGVWRNTIREDVWARIQALREG